MNMLTIAIGQIGKGIKGIYKRDPEKMKHVVDYENQRCKQVYKFTDSDEAFAEEWEPLTDNEESLDLSEMMLSRFKKEIPHYEDCTMVTITIDFATTSIEHVQIDYKDTSGNAQTYKSNGK